MISVVYSGSIHRAPETVKVKRSLETTWWWSTIHWPVTRCQQMSGRDATEATACCRHHREGYSVPCLARPGRTGVTNRGTAVLLLMWSSPPPFELTVPAP